MSTFEAKRNMPPLEGEGRDGSLESQSLSDIVSSIAQKQLTARRGRITYLCTNVNSIQSQPSFCRSTRGKTRKLSRIFVAVSMAATLIG